MRHRGRGHYVDDVGYLSCQSRPAGLLRVRPENFSDTSVSNSSVLLVSTSFPLFFVFKLFELVLSYLQLILGAIYFV